MRLYRGQRYGDPVGQWWTTDRADAEGFARSADPRRWVVLSIDVSGRRVRTWRFGDAGGGRTHYRFAPAMLRSVTLGARLVDGFLDLEPTASI